MTISPRYKGLLIATGVMILLFVIGGKFGLRTGSKDPRTHVMAFDTSSIVLIEVIDRADRKNDLRLVREGDAWQRISDRELDLEPLIQAHELLRQFHLLPVKRDMGMIGLVGERFQLDEASRCEIAFHQVDGITHELYIGSNTFAPGKVGVWTYVNVPGEKIVYSVEGLLTAGVRPGEEQ